MKTISINIYFMLCMILCSVSCFSEQDEFDPNRAPKEILTAAWERLILHPEEYDGKVISIGGWIDFQKQIFLFKDQESRNFNKDICSIKLGAESQFEKLIIKNDINKKLFIENYVIFISKFQYKPGDVNNEWVGEFIGPVEISIRNGRLETARYFDPSAVWK